MREQHLSFAHSPTALSPIPFRWIEDDVDGGAKVVPGFRQYRDLQPPLAGELEDLEPEIVRGFVTV